MKITIPRNELKAATAGFSKIVNKTTLPILGHIKFEADGHKIVAHGTDLDQHATYAFADAVCDGRGAFTVGFHQLRDLSRGSDADRVEFEPIGVDTLAVVNPVTGQAVRLEVQALDPEEWPSQVFEVKTAPVDDFLATYQKLAPFASSDNTRYVLNSCFLDVSEKGEGKARMITTDGRRLTVRNTMTLPLKESCIVPTTKFLSWIKGTCKIGTTKQGEAPWFVLETGPWTYFVKAVAAVYPNYRQVLPSDPGDNKITFAEDVSSLRQILKALPDEDKKGAITLRATSAGTLAVSARDNGKDVCIDLPSSTFTGKCRQTGVSRYFLADALDAGFRVFSFADEMSALVSDDGKGGKHVLMPMRVDSAVQVVGSETTENKAEPPAQPQQAAERRKVVEPATVSRIETSTQRQHEQKGTRKMSKNESAIEKLQVAYEAAKDKVKEAGNALADLASLIKDAMKEDKQRRAEIENVRNGLAKIQSIKV